MIGLTGQEIVLDNQNCALCLEHLKEVCHSKDFCLSSGMTITAVGGKEKLPMIGLVLCLPSTQLVKNIHLI